MVNLLSAALRSSQFGLKMCKTLVLWTLCSYCFFTTFCRNAPVVLLTRKPSKRFTHSSFRREVSTNVDLLKYSPLELCLQSCFSPPTWCCAGLGEGNAVSTQTFLSPFATLFLGLFGGPRELQPRPHVLRFSQWFWLRNSGSSFFLWEGVMLALTDVAIWWGHSLCVGVLRTNTSLTYLGSQSWPCCHLSWHDFTSSVIM